MELVAYQIRTGQAEVKISNELLVLKASSAIATILFEIQIAANVGVNKLLSNVGK